MTTQIPKSGDKQSSIALVPVPVFARKLVLKISVYINENLGENLRQNKNFFAGSVLIFTLVCFSCRMKNVVFVSTLNGAANNRLLNVG
jgi:hypothetical protein